ncbi:MAG: CCA tRNA nucleotidyltransferase [Chloroflexi bacterium]|nr:CCA tRNA nucleotidyltransferase [Chloroflexota bacterium]
MSALPLMAHPFLDAAPRSLIQQVASLLPPHAGAHVVGGFLRDALLDRPTNDLDIAVQGDAVAIARDLAAALGGSLVVLDEERQVARVALERQGHAWQVDVASQQGSLLEDLARRDFTVNAMALPLEALLAPDWPGRVVDPHGGRLDLQRKTIRQVSDAVFREDGVRLLRSVRLAARLGFTIDPATALAIRRDAHCLDGVAEERVRDELLAILACPDAMAHVYLLDDLGLLCRVLPELAWGKGVAQPKEHYWDVFRHNVETVGAVEGLLSRAYQPLWVLDAVPWNDDLAAHFQQPVTEGHARATLLKLAALLHDVAKPASKTIEESGRIRFFGHHTLGAEMCRVALTRLRMSGKGIALVETMVEHHLRPGQMSQGVDMPTPKAVYRYFCSAGDAAVDTLYLNMADYLSARGPMLEQKEWATYTGIIRHILDTGQRQHEPSLPALLDGHEIMTALRLTPGPTVGRILEAVREAQATGEITSKEEALALATHVLESGPEAHNA